ncbi:hypothetical protein GDO81_025888 [Engystomops pustulosus]|uniref:Taste receptor type 2 n=1 Tax=Engystomops pustulosus TaxID=76066 RepID=A0AAV6ZFL6_ENGPU|nr:hypothetical protein GDO81_025888 [Engystomops pustulosus]
MADTTEGDTDVLYLGVLVPGLMALIAGLVIHSFIIGVNVSDWWRGRSVTPVDHIVTSLGILRMCIQCVSILGFLLYGFFLRSLKARVILVITNTVYNVLIFTNIWLTSLLSIVYYLKISNLHTRLFLYLRRMMLPRTGRLIVALILFCALYSLMSVLLLISNKSNKGKYNTTSNNEFIGCNSIHSTYIIPIGTFLPLIFNFTSSVLLFVSLYHHTTRMKMSSNLSINLETYYSTMRFVGFTFLYNTVYFMGHFTNVFYLCFYCTTIEWVYVAVGFLPVLHSAYLVQGTAKLRIQMSKVVQNIIDFFTPKKVAEDGNNIE